MSSRQIEQLVGSFVSTDSNVCSGRRSNSSLDSPLFYNQKMLLHLNTVWTIDVKNV